MTLPKTNSRPKLPQKEARSYSNCHPFSAAVQFQGGYTLYMCSIYYTYYTRLQHAWEVYVWKALSFLSIYTVLHMIIHSNALLFNGHLPWQGRHLHRLVERSHRVSSWDFIEQRLAGPGPLWEAGIKISKHLNPNIEAIDDGDIIKVSTVWDECELHSCRHTIEALSRTSCKKKDASPPLYAQIQT